MSITSELAYRYQQIRSLQYSASYAIFTRLLGLVPGVKPLEDPATPELRLKVLASLDELFKKDAEAMAAGVFPWTVLLPEDPRDFVFRLPRLFLDGLGMARRRERRKTRSFGRRAQDWLSRMPEYYRRNFHYQTDGYLSKVSADLYEHQVEALFGGGADAMRRLMLPPMKQTLQNADAAPMLLDVGAGTGRASQLVHRTFPTARITLVDLSPHYLEKAVQRTPASKRWFNAVQGDATQLPFKDATFDGVYSVFMFHELPQDVRLSALKEMKRVLKPGGSVYVVDSIQLHDKPEFVPLIKAFPQNYHEPFYPNYISNPLEPLLEQAGFRDVQSHAQFVSKALWARL